MRPQPATDTVRVTASIPFVEQLARRVAATMPHSIDIGDLVQDGVLGLIDAANRFDESRGIKFETFAERRVRGAMIDALRKDAWPRGVRRQRRELEAAREELRRELGCEPSLADLAAKMGSDEKRLGRTIVRINAIESTSPLANNDHLDEVHAAGRAHPVRARSSRRGLRALRGEAAREGRDRLAAAARADGDQPLLLQGSDDEADWRRDRRQRVARLAAARARHRPPAHGALGAGAGCGSRGDHPHGDPRVPPEAGDGQGHAAGHRADARRWSWTTPAFRGRRATSRRCGTA